MRIKKLRSLICAILVLTCTVFLVACGNKEENKEPEVKLEAIAITTAPNKTAYVVGEKFNNTGMVVKASYSNDTSKEVTTYTISKTTALALTDVKVTVSFTDTEVTKTADVAITVTAVAQPDVLASITVTPLKTAYLVGETFSTNGMVVTANYTNGKTAVITDYTVSKVDALAVGDTSVTISYTEGSVTKTASVAITVTTEAAPKTLSALAITTQPDKTDYTVGEAFDKSGMVVTANYSDGSTKVVVDYKLNKTTLGINDTTITVSFTEGGVTKTATVTVTIIRPADSGVFEDVVALIPTAEIGETWIKTVIDTELEKVKTDFYAALSTARITTTDAAAIVDVLENLGDYDFTSGPNVFAFVDDLYTAGVSNAKTASFIFDMVVAANGTLDELKTAAVIGNFDNKEQYDEFHAIIDQVIEAYEEVIDLSKTDFVAAFTALLDIARISETSESAFNTHGTDISDMIETLDREEFISAVTAYKTDLSASLTALTPEAMTAIMNLYKAILPYGIETSLDMQIASLRSTLNDETTDRNGNLSYWQERLPQQESATEPYAVMEIELCNKMIALCQAEKTQYDYYIAEYTIWRDYYTDFVAYLNTLEDNGGYDITWYEDQIPYYEGMIQEETDRKQSLSEALDMLEEIDIDEYIADATALIDDLTADFVTVRTMLLATVNRIDTEMAGAVYDAINDEDYGAGLIIIGKLMHAGLNAQGGFTEADLEEDIVVDYVNLMFPYIEMFILSADTEYGKTDIIEMTNEGITDIYSECAALNGKDYGDASVTVVHEDYDGEYPMLAQMFYSVRLAEEQAGTGK